MSSRVKSALQAFQLDTVISRGAIVHGTRTPEAGELIKLPGPNMAMSELVSHHFHQMWKFPKELEKVSWRRSVRTIAQDHPVSTPHTNNAVDCWVLSSSLSSSSSSSSPAASHCCHHCHHHHHHHHQTSSIIVIVIVPFVNVIFVVVLTSIIIERHGERELKVPSLR